jgi:hypothetical protein
VKIKRLVGLLVIVWAIALPGCAKLEFYKNPDLSGPQEGVKFYYSKPYLLVTRTSSMSSDGKTGTTSVQGSVVYLPDQKNPVYARLKPGYGSANLSLSITDGKLSSVGQQTDTKIPETITALASMTTAAAALMVPRPPIAKLPEKPEWTLYEIDNSSGKTVLTEVPLPK